MKILEFISYVIFFIFVLESNVSVVGYVIIKFVGEIDEVKNLIVIVVL